MEQLRTNRTWVKYWLLSAVTCGIYGLVMNYHLVQEINKTGKDGKTTKNFWLVFFVLAPITLGIYGWIYNAGIAQRYGDEARRRGMDTKLNSSTFWGWGFFGTLLCGIGPLVFAHKLLQAANYVNADYNQKGE